MTETIRTTVLATFVVVMSVPAFAAEIATRAELDALLSGSEEYLEDFEEVSLHAGTVLPLPNPFDQSAWPELIGGVAYSSSLDLAMYAGFLHGDDSNVLSGHDDVTITFDEPQLAVGFDVDGTGTAMALTITFRHHETIIDTWVREIGAFEEPFLGWQNANGITSVTIDAPGDAVVRIDNVGWGVVVDQPCAGDVDDDGTIGFVDLVAVLSAWGNCTCPADVTGEGDVDFKDLLVVLSTWGPC